MQLCPVASRSMDCFVKRPSLHLSHLLAAVGLVQRLPVGVGFALCMLVGCFLYPSAAAQDVGDAPPSEAIRAAGDSVATDPGQLQVSGFMFLDKNGNLVYVPGMSYEKWVQLDSGGKQSGQVVVFDPFRISGRVYERRAELEIDLSVTVEPTGGQLISIPLGMKNFPLLRPAEISSKPPANKDELELVDTTADGLELKVRTKRKKKIKIKLFATASVESGPPKLLKFELPKVPCNIDLEMDAGNLDGEISGSQQTTLKPLKTRDGKTRFQITGVGGSFLLQWQNKSVDVESIPRLESESLVEVDWGSPQDDPIASVKLTVRNLRDRGAAIDRLQVEFPPGVVTLDTPILEASGRRVIEVADAKIDN